MILETFKIIIDFHNVKSSPHVKQVDHQKFAIQSSEEQIMATNLKKSFLLCKQHFCRNTSVEFSHNDLVMVTKSPFVKKSQVVTELHWEL